MSSASSNLQPHSGVSPASQVLGVSRKFQNKRLKISRNNNYQADASELLEHLKDMFPLYYRHSKVFKYTQLVNSPRKG